MNLIAVVLILLVGGSSFAMAQSAGGSSSGSSAASGTAANGSTGYQGSTLSTGHTISGTAGFSHPDTGDALNHEGTADPEASSVTQPPTSHDNSVDTPAANKAMNSLGNTHTGILKK